MNPEIQLHLEIEADGLSETASLFREITLPFVPAKGQVLSFGHGAHPTCVIEEVGYYVDENEWLVGAKIVASNKAHMLWTMVQLVSGSGFVVVETDIQHSLLNEDTLVECPLGQTTGWIFASHKVDHLVLMFAREWTGMNIPPPSRPRLRLVSRSVDSDTEKLDNEESDPHES